MRGAISFKKSSLYIHSDAAMSLVPMVAHDASMGHRVLWVARLDYRGNPVHYFHHFHIGEREEVEHCGGAHARIDPDVDYNISHCPCGQHTIDRRVAVGHDEVLHRVEFRFFEHCPRDPSLWHLESGKRL